MKTLKHVSLSCRDGRMEIAPHLYETTVNAETQITVHSKRPRLHAPSTDACTPQPPAQQASSSELSRKSQYLNLDIKSHESDSTGSAAVKTFPGR